MNEKNPIHEVIIFISNKSKHFAKKIKPVENLSLLVKIILDGAQIFL